MPEPLPRDDAPAPDSTLEAGEVCTSCVQPNPTGRNYCAHCGAPHTLLAFNPFDQTLVEGFAYRRAVEGPPSTIILIGNWLLFGPGLLYFLLCLLPGGKEGRDDPAFAGYFVLPFIAIPILYRTTANYLRKRRRHLTFPPEGAD